MLCADQLKTSTSTLPPLPFPTPEQTPRIWTFWRLDRSILYSFHSMTKTNYAAKIPLTVQLLRKKKIHLANCHISSVQLFHLVQTRVFTGVSDFGRPQKKHIWNLTIPAQFSTLDLGKCQIRLPKKVLPVNFPTPRTQKIVKYPWIAGEGGGRGGWSFDLILSREAALNDFPLMTLLFCFKVRDVESTSTLK